MSKADLLKELAKDVSASFLSDEKEKNLEKDCFISTGCTLLDLALGGGLRIGRIINIIGDESTGKSLVAAECIASVQNRNKGIGIYDDAEGTLDGDRAEMFGVKVEETLMKCSGTVEDFFENLQTISKTMEGKDVPSLYVLDSLDSLSSRAELSRKIDEGSFGGEKPKKMSEIFRRLNVKLADANITIIVISQTRDNIGVTFGEKKTITGGKALKFYSSQRIMLSQIGRLKLGEKLVGVKMRAKIVKNKVAPPLKEVDFEVLFDYGIDDLSTNIEYLSANTDFFGSSRGWYQYGDKKYRKWDLVAHIEGNNLQDVIVGEVIKAWELLDVDGRTDRLRKYEEVLEINE